MARFALDFGEGGAVGWVEGDGGRGRFLFLGVWGRWVDGVSDMVERGQLLHNFLINLMQLHTSINIAYLSQHLKLLNHRYLLILKLCQSPLQSDYIIIRPARMLPSLEDAAGEDFIVAGEGENADGGGGLAHHLAPGFDVGEVAGEAV